MAATAKKRKTRPKTSHAPAPASHVPDLPPGTPATLPLSVLHPSPLNKRRFRPHAAEDRELTASIRALGILEPLLVRPLGDDTYELLAGERRWRCAQAAGLAEAPVVVHQVDDRTAGLLLFAENFHRQDLHFLEEAETVADLLGAGWTHEQIAGKVGRSASWVARRARLCTLHEEVRAGIADSDHALSAWGVAHFEELALLEPAAQLEVLAENDGYLEELSPSDLRRVIAGRTHDLARAPWDLGDEALLPEAGACSACPARTSCEPLLFPEEEMQAAAGGEEMPGGGRGRRARRSGPVDRCLRPGCWQSKTEALLARKEAELLAKHPEAIRLSTSGRGGAVPSWSVDRATRKTPGALPALVVDGPQLGAVQWVTRRRPLPSPSSRSGSSGVGSGPIAMPAGPRRSTLAERRQRLQARRMLRAIEALVPDIEAATVVPSLAQVAALAAVFGTRHTFTCGWYTPEHDLPASLEDLKAHPAEPSARVAAPSASFADRLASPDDPRSGLADPASLDGSEASLDDPAGFEDPPARDLYPLALEYGAANPTLLAGTLWQRVRPVLLARLKTNDRPADAGRAFAEARHLATLCGLDAEIYLARATADLPDPKSWAKEEAALQAARAQTPTEELEPPPDEEDLLCPECGDPLPPGRILCDTCNDGDPAPGDDLGFDDELTTLGPLDAEALCY